MSLLCSEDRRALLVQARRAIVEAVNGKPAAQVSHRLDADPPQNPQPGVFVTLFHRGHLRGCVGQIETLEPLIEVVARCAVAAACEDPRFTPVVQSELPIRRVVVYRNGVAYFERSGHVETDTVHFKMKQEEVGDFLATLAVMAVAALMLWRERA